MDNKNDNNKTRVVNNDEIRAHNGSGGRVHSVSESSATPPKKSKPTVNPPRRTINTPKRDISIPQTKHDSSVPQAQSISKPQVKSSVKISENADNKASSIPPNMTRVANPRKMTTASQRPTYDDNAATRQIDITRRTAVPTPKLNVPSKPSDNKEATREMNISHRPVNAVARKSTPSANKPIQSNSPHVQQTTNDDDYAYEDHGGEAVGGALSSVLKAVIYIVSVLVVSAFLSYFGIMVCNDVFAFIKDSTETVVTVPEYATINDIAKMLKENKIIRYPSIFKLYAKLRKGSSEYVAGDYTITPSMSYDALLNEFKEDVPERQQVSITIPEGYTVDEIIELFLSKGMGTREGFVDAIENFEWDYWFVLEADENRDSARKYRLEGYLYPDTYYYFSDSSELTIISKMLQNFEVKFPQELKDRCTALGYTVDEIITIASMIQMEAKYPSEFPYISAVFHNRLNNPSGETQGLLQSDPTIQYALGGHEILTAENMELDSPYNTYKNKGLPPSPICNPDLNAINNALYPEPIDYLYFVAQDNGYHLFASTYDEHIQNRLIVGR